MPEKSLVLRSVTLLQQRGAKSLELARKALREEQIQHKPLAKALQYFADETFRFVLHPGLLSVYCESVGGNPDDVINVGAAMTLLVAAADIHDDIIDNSTVKNGKPTVLGKFGRDIAVLAGDGFLIKGTYLLHRAIKDFSDDKNNSILQLVEQAFFNLSSAEAEEAKLRGNISVTGKEYLELLKRKTVVAKATAEIGALIGNASLDEAQALGEIGATVGLLGTLRDEFIDVYEADELRNRFTNEILPLPILNVFQNSHKKEQIIKLLTSGKLTKKKREKIVDLVLSTEETAELKNYMQFLVASGLRSASQLRGEKRLLLLLLQSAVEDLT